MKKKKVYLTLQNGDTFQGYAFGAEGEITGELIFSTGMVGYIETLTDPSNYGQIVVQTFPLIGNYGMISADVESDRAWVSAYVVREICAEPSNFRTENDLESYLKAQGVIGIYGVDTRQLTKILREKGAMNARISEKPLSEQEKKELSAYKIENAVNMVAPKEKNIYGDNAKYTIALWDFGAKKSTISNLLARDCKVISLPATSTAEEVLSSGADAIILSDGPGDPTENVQIISQIQKVLGKKPIYALGLGHQLLALAFGAKVKKSKYGHRGANQPVKSQENGRVCISTQNHGYDIVTDSIKVGKISYKNVNDGTCEGIDYEEMHAFSTQFTPESCDAGNIENPIYKKFFALIEKERENA